MSKRPRLVCGVGVNDAGYVVHRFKNNKMIWSCPFYQAWAHMLKRCYSQKIQARYPTYAGCIVAEEWHKFSSFRQWMIEQPWIGNHLDKDILFSGNTIYSKDTCVFIPSALNLFMTDRAAARGEWPIGVSWHKESGKLRAGCRNPFTSKKEFLGFYDCPKQAHEAWRKRKHELACMYADQQTDPRIAEALRNRYKKHE